MSMVWTFFGVAAVISAVIGGPVCRFLAGGNVVDRPGERSSHQRPTVRGGGLGVVAVVLGGGVCLGVSHGWMPLAGVLAAMLLLAGISFWDDLRSLGPWVRFTCHAVAAVVVVSSLGLWGSGVALGLEVGRVYPIPPWLGLAGACIWLAGYTNAFNFMDGINGLAALQAVIAGAGSGLLASLASGLWDLPSALFAWMVAGAAAGFVPHNFPRARMFMGDVGSAPLGFLLAVTVLWVPRDAGWWLVIPLLLLHTNFVLDTGITLLRRVVRGERWYLPHREHFYQRLLRSGRTHAFVTLWEAGLQTVVLGLLVAYLHVGVPARIGIAAAILMLWGGFFAWCERSFRAGGSSER